MKKYTEEERKKHELKKLRRDQNRIVRQPRAVIRNWLRDKSDLLILASEYDPESTFITLMPYLGDSRPFVIYSECLEVHHHGFPLHGPHLFFRSL